MMSPSSELLDTGQSNWSPPMAKWNGDVVSGGGPLHYCPGRARCRFECTAISNVSPDFDIDGRCYSVTELSEVFEGGRVDIQHPYYAFEHDCATGRTFRCVISQTQFSPSYTSEFDGGCFCTCMYFRHTFSEVVLLVQATLIIVTVNMYICTSG